MQVEIELSTQTLEWLYEAVWHDWTHLFKTEPKYDRTWKRTLPDLQQPNVKWLKRAGATPRIVCEFTQNQLVNKVSTANPCT